MKNDATYYSELQAGAEYLAETTPDAAERDVHLKMARIYRERALDAGGPPAVRTCHEDWSPSPIDGSVSSH